MAGKSDIEAGKAFVTLYVKNSALVKGLQSAQRQLSSIGTAVAKVGTVTGAAGSVIASPFVAAATVFAKTGTDLERMSQRTSATTDALSELGYAATTIGGDIGQVESAVSSMNSVLASAQRFDAGAIQSLARLGVTLQDLQGKTKSEQFEELADRISRVADPAERAARATAIFGGAGQSLLPLLNQGAKGIQALREEAQDLGLSIGPQQAKATADLSLSWTKATEAIRGATLAIGSALAPDLQRVGALVVDVIRSVTKWIRENSGLAVTIAKVAAGIMAAGASIVALGLGISAAGAAFGGLATAATAAAAVVAAAWGLVTSPAILAAAAIAALVAKFVDLRKVGEDAAGKLKGAWGAIGEAVADVVDDIQVAWEGIKGAIASGDLAAAAGVAWAGVKAVFAGAAQKLNEIWQDVKFKFLEMWQGAQHALAGYFLDGMAAIETGWTNLLAAMQSAWSSFSTMFMNTFNRMQQRVGELIIRAAEKSGVVSKDFAKVWRESLNTPLEEGIANRTAGNEQAQREIEQRRQAGISRIAADRASQQDVLDQMRGEQTAANERARDAAKKRAEDELAEARRLLREKSAVMAGDEARASKKAVEDAAGAGGPAINYEAMRTVSGTFSAASAAAMGGGGSRLERLTERQVKLMERQREREMETLATLKNIERKLAIG